MQALCTGPSVRLQRAKRVLGCEARSLFAERLLRGGARTGQIEDERRTPTRAVPVNN
jgi:hypothetical protein